ncbi:MAG TPA: ABC transporter permease [Candidatus Copromorpha excrementigallinarum]|uniref:ABC transporter permease n=1 Tax=Candidatus Allocopromorpha excrementigallinarum TaxID=2840742 RepID=A0A9D1I1Z7_9FIRM|nr:ABC transporter permease [Candidatus Copromorpha excrementigallinarum]
MDTIVQGIGEAVKLIFTADEEIFEIVGLSLYVSFSSVIISTVMGIPLGILIGTYDFKGKGIIVRLIYTFMSLPPVIAGLTVFLILMRRGPLGSLQLNYTVTAMIIAQICLVTPIITGLTYNIVKEKAAVVNALGITLGAGRAERMRLLIYEMRVGIITAVVSGFGRAVSEVGAVMIVGGNIKGKTRVMTTYISELKGMGDYERAIAVGIILLCIAFIINGVLYYFQERESR